MNHNAVPGVFCWTRFGTEAGEPIAALLARKERERLETDGIFYWGIGNSIAPALKVLIAQERQPEVLFSPIRSRPREIDRRPTSVVRWRAGQTLDGGDHELPSSACVISRETVPLRAHYALVCRSEVRLALGDHGVVDAGRLVNLLSGNRLGSSQVTAVVTKLSAKLRGTAYPISFRAALVEPYFVRLTEPDQSDERGLLVFGQFDRAVSEIFHVLSPPS